jgi:hypothetical protein
MITAAAPITMANAAGSGTTVSETSSPFPAR